MRTKLALRMALAIAWGVSLASVSHAERFPFFSKITQEAEQSTPTSESTAVVPASVRLTSEGEIQADDSKIMTVSASCDQCAACDAGLLCQECELCETEDCNAFYHWWHEQTRSRRRHSYGMNKRWHRWFLNPICSPCGDPNYGYHQTRWRPYFGYVEVVTPQWTEVPIPAAEPELLPEAGQGEELMTPPDSAQWQTPHSFR